MRIAITAGGTGGHVYPAQAVLDELKRRELESGKIEINLLFLSGGTDIDLKHTNVKAKRIMSGKYRRDAPWTLPANIFKTCAGIIQSFWHLFFFMPDVVLSTGGYGALPVSIASIIFFIPLVIHEQNAVPGVANAITGKFARKICLTFDKAQEFFSKKKTVKTGLPIRKALLGKKRAEAIEYYKLDGTVPVLFISGGSQGSQPINATVIEILDKLIAHCHVIHQVGEENLPLMKLETNEVLRESPYKNRYHIYGLLKDEEMS